MKKYLVWILTCVLVITGLSTSTVLAYDYDLDSAIEEYNANIEELGLDDDKEKKAKVIKDDVNDEVFEEYGVIVVGDMHDDGYPINIPRDSNGNVPQSDIDKYGKPRYLGQNGFGTYIVNHDYYPDSKPKADDNFESRHWLTPDDPLTENSVIDKWVKAPSIYDEVGAVNKYYDNFLKGFLKSFGYSCSPSFREELTAAVNNRDSSNLSIDFKPYISVLEPPTDNSSGIAVMFHDGSSAGGTVFYALVELVANDDLAKKEYSDDFDFSCFSDYVVNQDLPMYDFTFWIAAWDGIDHEEEFYVQLFHHEEVNWKEVREEIGHITLDEDNYLNWFTFQMTATPVYAVIYRKGVEWDRWKDNIPFQQEFWNGYTREYEGETYYYYDTYSYDNHGMRYIGPGAMDLIPNANVEKWRDEFKVY